MGLVGHRVVSGEGLVRCWVSAKEEGAGLTVYLISAEEEGVGLMGPSFFAEGVEEEALGSSPSGSVCNRCLLSRAHPCPHVPLPPPPLCALRALGDFP